MLLVCSCKWYPKRQSVFSNLTRRHTQRSETNTRPKREMERYIERARMNKTTNKQAEGNIFFSIVNGCFRSPDSHQNKNNTALFLCHVCSTIVIIMLVVFWLLFYLGYPFAVFVVPVPNSKYTLSLKKWQENKPPPFVHGSNLLRIKCTVAMTMTIYVSIEQLIQKSSDFGVQFSFIWHLLSLHRSTCVLFHATKIAIQRAQARQMHCVFPLKCQIECCYRGIFNPSLATSKRDLNKVYSVLLLISVNVVLNALCIETEKWGKSKKCLLLEIRWKSQYIWFAFFLQIGFESKVLRSTIKQQSS